MELLANMKQQLTLKKRKTLTEVDSKLENSSLKRKITTLGKKDWDAKSKTMYLEK